MSAFVEPEFTISVSWTGSTAVVRVSGELDLATAPKLGRALEDLDTTTSFVELDLAGVWFADASAVARLVRTRRRLNQEGRRMVLTEVSDEVRHVLESTGLIDDFDVAA